MTELDRTQQRIVGVLIEKELSVPGSYPLTENALLAGCNQKSNRDPEMSLEPFEVHGALNALMSADWAKSTKVAGGHTTRYAHRLESNHAVDDREKAVLCELLVRGPQAPGALKPRVARLNFHATPAEIEEVLRGLASRPVPLVQQLARRPRERDHRWEHRLGPAGAVAPVASQREADDAEDTEDVHDVDVHDVEGGTCPPPKARPAVAPPIPSPSPASFANVDPELEERVTKLELDLAELREEVRRLGGS